MRSCFAPGSRVLVAVAGGGREVIALVRAGFQVAGFSITTFYAWGGYGAVVAKS